MALKMRRISHKVMQEYNRLQRLYLVVGVCAPRMEARVQDLMQNQLGGRTYVYED